MFELPCLAISTARFLEYAKESDTRIQHFTEEAGFGLYDRTNLFGQRAMQELRQPLSAYLLKVRKEFGMDPDAI